MYFSKICKNCIKDKCLTLFYKDSSIKNGYKAICKECFYKRRKELEISESLEKRNKRLNKNNELKRNKLKNNRKEVLCAHCAKIFLPIRKNKIYCSNSCASKGKPELHLKRLMYSRNTYKKNMEWLENYKLSLGCIDCGYNSHSEALQLDHEGIKNAEISSLRHNLIKLKEEIEKGKCVVRCANCHAIKTRERKNNKI